MRGAKKANPSQLVGHQEVKLPSSLGSGKVQPHSIRQIRETGLGEKKKKKNRRAGTDESMGGKGQFSWKEEPKRVRTWTGTSRKRGREKQSGAAFIMSMNSNDMNDPLLSLYNLIISSNAFLLKVPRTHIVREGGAPPHPLLTVPSRARV